MKLSRRRTLKILAASASAVTSLPIDCLPEPATLPSLAAEKAGAGELVDLASLGHAKMWDGNPGVEWDEPRDVWHVEVDFAEPSAIPPEGAVTLEYWVSTWPQRLGRSAIVADTPWQGEWRAISTTRAIKGKTVIWRFNPLSETENPKAKNRPAFTPAFRNTLKIRVRAHTVTPISAALRIYGDSWWAMREVNIQSGCEGQPVFQISPTAYNGIILDSKPLDEEPGGVRLNVLYTEHELFSNDRTILTLGAGSHAFGVSMDDVIERKAIYIKPVGMFIGDGRTGQNFTLFQQSGAMRRGEDIISRISSHPEQSLTRAMAEIPRLAFTTRAGHHPVRYFPLGFPASREKYGLDFNGHVFISKSGSKAMKEDLERMSWAGDEIYFRLGTGAVPDFREREGGARQLLLDEYLPLVITRWQQEGIEYEERTYSTLLEAPFNDNSLRGDEPSVLLIRVSAHNPGPQQLQARVWLVVSPDERLEFHADMLTGVGNSEGQYAHPRLRVTVHAEDGTIGLEKMPPESTYMGRALLWTVPVAAGSTVALNINVPFRSIVLPADQDKVKLMRFESRLDETLAYWRQSISPGMQISVPDEEFNVFFRSVLQHILVSSERDLKTGYDMCPCGTYGYNVFANETDVQVRLLDMRNLPDLAWRYLRPIVELQGSKPLPGRFRDSAGEFFGMRVDADHDYSGSGYNLNHGWTLWTICEHYLFTRNQEWLRSVMPHLRKAVDWIIKERSATMEYTPEGGPVPEYGLLPAGQLEDPQDWGYWFAVDAYAYRGLKGAAEAVRAIDPNEGERLKREAVAYREDIRRAVFHAMSSAPAVSLRDGTFIPCVPSCASKHGRPDGWVRNVLYGAHSLIDCGVISADEPLATWILQDYEDNLFMAKDSLCIADRDWFSRGGVALQPNLVNTFTSYLKRDQLPQAIRAFYNVFAISYYPDVNCFTEWVPTLGIGGGPFFKTSDEAAFLIWLRQMLVCEDDDRLYLNSGAPKNWFLPGRIIRVEHAATFFGDMGFRVEAHPEHGFIEARVSLPQRNRPGEVRLRLRHPDNKKIGRVELNGQAWNHFDAEREMISLPPQENTCSLRAYY